LGISTLENYHGKITHEIARKLVEINPRYFHLLDKPLQQNDLIVRTALYKLPSIIQDISTQHLHYSKYLKIALRQNGELIRYIPKELITFELIHLAVKSNGNAYLYLDSKTQNNPEIALAAIKQYPEIYHQLSLHFQNDERFVWAALNGNPNLYKDLPKAFQNDLKICEYVYSKFPRMMEFMPKKLLNNREKILQAMDKDPDAWLYLPKKFQYNDDIIRNCAYNSAQVFTQLILTDHIYPHPEYICQRLKKQDLYMYLPIQIRENPDISLQAIEQDIHNIYYIPVALMKNNDFMEKIYSIFRKHCKAEWQNFKQNYDLLLQ